MDISLFKQKDEFPFYILRKLEAIPIDYSDSQLSIAKANARGEKHLEASVVVLLFYKNSEFVFQLIKRSESVAQGGDISCPGGMLEKSTDNMLSHILLKTGLIRAADNRPLDILPNRDEQTAALIRLFLMNGLREAWEEIGLSPLNVSFLGALPTYSLTYFARTIFPLVCLVRETYDFQLSSEVEKILEIPLTSFFQKESYALLEIESDQGASHPRYDVKFPCLVIPGANGENDILWGATFQILTRFLKILDNSFSPDLSSSRTVAKKLSAHYTSGNRA